ncbi:hypothetical protein THAOC_15068 [Thalassiosira oceanica]|uniref:Uncharacterized protein n=1 Tax=Thalassiosira oceanica TaxID=159749 RepID=K0STB4_THAOC|nr:hypothetical protein THAOC_15068 [Thalassiosira oceanica]|eukprot:EJK64221.1 hypothetical protein THAOC_15068 [Thalassiosira oceanica]
MEELDSSYHCFLCQPSWANPTGNFSPLLLWALLRPPILALSSIYLALLLTIVRRTILGFDGKGARSYGGTLVSRYGWQATHRVEHGLVQLFVVGAELQLVCCMQPCDAMMIMPLPTIRRRQWCLAASNEART